MARGKSEPVDTPEQAIAWAVRDLKSRASKLDEAAAMIEPMWYRANDAMKQNPWMEYAAFAEVGEYVLYAISAKASHMKTMAAGMPKTSWTLVLAVDGEALGGGPAEDIEQAKKYARMAYQATQGLILGGDA